jgi:high affinity cGMP-specific 3',5'-cyclic phosphodiesterase 9
LRSGKIEWGKAHDVSPLEAHHVDLAMRLLHDPARDIRRNLSPENRSLFDQMFESCVLGTDTAFHKQLKDGWNAAVAAFSYDNPDHRLILMKMLLCCADISNEVRPFEMSQFFGDRIWQEFGDQYDREIREGLPPTEFMNPNNFPLAHSQACFIGGMQRPMWKMLVDFVPVLGPFLDRIDVVYKQWTSVLMHEESAWLQNTIDTLRPGSSQKRSFEAGQVIVRKDEPSSELFFVLSGVLDVCAVEGGMVFDVLNPGAFFGEIAVLNSTPENPVLRTATVYARVPATVLAVDGAAVRSLAAEDRNFNMRLQEVKKQRMAYESRWDSLAGNAASIAQTVGGEEMLWQMGG